MGGDRTKSHAITVNANSFSNNVTTIGPHVVRTIGLKLMNETDVKAYAAASPIFLDSDDDSSIEKEHLKIIVKKPIDLKFTILEQDVAQ